MANQQRNIKDALAKREEQKVKSPVNTMRVMLKAMAKEIEAALPSMVSSERFQRVALTAFSSNTKLQSCDPVSFIAAMMTAAQLGLEPNTPLGQAYLIPYGNQVQFQLGYKGLLELAQRSDKFKAIYAHAVYEHDVFEIEFGLEPVLKHKPVFSNRGNPIGYYAVYKLVNGGESFFFMTKEDVEDFAKEKSKTFMNGPWQSDFDAMAKKTVIKQLLKYAPISIELQREMVQDETVKRSVDANMDLVEPEIIDVGTYEDHVVDEVTGEVYASKSKQE